MERPPHHPHHPPRPGDGPPDAQGVASDPSASPSPPAGSTPPSAASQTRCVLLAAQDHPVPGTLVQIMSRRGFQMSVAADAPSALLEAIETQATALLVVEPAHQPQGAELIDTVRCYFPRLALWQVTDHHGQPQLNAIQGDPLKAAEPAESTKPDNASKPLPTNPPRLFAEGEPGPIVTKDELAMLIGSTPPSFPPVPPQRAAE